MESQILEPPSSVPMIMGRTSSTTPMTPMVYLYSQSVSMLGTAMRVTTMTPMPTKSQTTWLNARLGARRVTNVMPMPASTKVMGRMAGSAPGAKCRTAMWATANAAKSPRGTASELSERETCMFTT